jgi:probable rRNA maturation factor
LRKVLGSILESRSVEGELSIALVDDREIRRVHAEFLDDDTATDVISFHYDDGGPGPFGELVISVETALREARDRRIPPQVELERYAIHGVLHLLGYDDHTPEGRRQMRRLEGRYLSKAEDGI